MPHTLRDNLQAFHAWRRKPTAIAELVVGEDALVRGVVETAGFVAPALITGRECVAGNVQLWMEDNVQKRVRWAHTRASLAFFVLDERGDRLLVEDAELILSHVPEEDVTQAAGEQTHAGTPFWEFVQEQRLAIATTFYTATEQLIVPGAHVEVYGRVGQRPWMDRGAYREQLVHVTSIGAHGDAHVLVRPAPSASGAADVGHT